LLQQTHANAARSKLERRFTAGKAGADYGDLLRVH
jgi:hypothetical protein